MRHRWRTLYHSGPSTTLPPPNPPCLQCFNGGNNSCGTYYRLMEPSLLPPRTSAPLPPFRGTLHAINGVSRPRPTVLARRRASLPSRAAEPSWWTLGARQERVGPHHPRRNRLGEEGGGVTGGCPTGSTHNASHYRRQDVILQLFA
jgi:hypothetical protein